MEAGVVCR